MVICERLDPQQEGSEMWFKIYSFILWTFVRTVVFHPASAYTIVPHSITGVWWNGGGVLGGGLVGLPWEAVWEKLIPKI